MIERTLYDITQIHRGISILPLLILNDDKTRQRLIQCEYEEAGSIKIEVIPFEKICIVPVFDNDPRRYSIEKGVFYSVILDDNYQEIHRGEERTTVKLYLDDKTFLQIISEFGEKNKV